LGLVDDERWAFFEAKRSGASNEIARLERLVVHPHHLTSDQASNLLDTPLAREAHAFDLLRRPEVTYRSLSEVASVGVPDWMSTCTDERLIEQVQQQVEVQARYSGYIDRQQTEIDRQRRQEELLVPADIDYAQVRGLSNEVRQRLASVRPDSIGQASRIPGVTPAAISLLLVHLKRHAMSESSKLAV
jgi:tRNA uridine 5-carboxymethylaminomethyl modification enzyme